MALPDYSGAMSRNKVQRQRKKENRQQRRVKNATAAATPVGTPYTPPPPSEQEDYTLNTGTGYQGQYVAPQGGSNTPFYDPNASYARPGDEYYRPPDQGSALAQRVYDEDPAGY